MARLLLAKRDMQCWRVGCTLVISMHLSRAYQCLSAKVHVRGALSNEIIKRPRLHVRFASSSTYLLMRAQYLKMHESRSYTTDLIKIGIERAKMQSKHTHICIYGVSLNASFRFRDSLNFQFNRKYLKIYACILNEVS